MTMLRGLLLKFLLAVALATAAVGDARAAVVMTFWSQEFGSNFPHAFFTLDGVPDAGGDPVKLTYGFTAKAITPAILMGTVPGRIDIAKQSYIDNSNAHFSVVLSDAQYDAVLALVAEWGEEGDHRYNLNRRNCVHFVAEAARRAGLVVTEPKKLMKKPRSFTQSLVAPNAARVRVIEQPAAGYYAMLANEAAVPAPAPASVSPVAEPATVP